MRKLQKQEILSFIENLHQAHREIKKALYQKKDALVQNMLSECQEFAISLGNIIEKTEGEEHITVTYIEEYCEALFHVFEIVKNQQADENKIYKTLKKQLIHIENSVKNDIQVKKEIVFLPYKASMWDSLESVYLAAKADCDCDTYCVPIPYYDINSDRSFGQMHYEGGEYPDGIEITDWQSYNLEERKPDVVYIHNPYDEWNLVTSVHPRYYSSNLKKYTDTLIYIPYYCTAGGMNRAQDLCSGYIYADYIVIQAPKFQKYFDQGISKKKFLPLGSPKFDRIIHKCQNPLVPSKEWKERIGDRKVYFYNISISGMLANTENFLKKIQYVFSCFTGREDVCLLWRPHPLLETTFNSLRPQYRVVYEMLKKYFIDNNLGIFDETPDVGNSIALSDAYVGDEGTSILSLFGITGKPIFILNNAVHDTPKKNDWQKEINILLDMVSIGQDCFAIKNHKLYVSKPYQYDYKYFCDLADKVYGRYYLAVYEMNGKKYVCPMNEQHILRLGENGVEEKIELEHRVEIKNSFSAAVKYDKYLLLIPYKYPAIVRYDTLTGEIVYFDENVDMLVKSINGQDMMIGGICLYRDNLYIAPLVGKQIYVLHIESGKTDIISLPLENWHGCGGIFGYKDELWLTPYKVERMIVKWNPLTGQIRKYIGFPDDFKYEENPFGIPAFYGDYMYLTPIYSNMYIRLNMYTGEFTQWRPVFEDEDGSEIPPCTFLLSESGDMGDNFKIYFNNQVRLYNINMETYECKEIKIQFDINELKRHELGFGECAEGVKYACKETFFNTLNNFLDGEIVGNPFDKNSQLAAYQEIIANYDGTCGQKIHEFTKREY